MNSELACLPGRPRDADELTFSAPWEAQVFAMAISLHKRGLFTWTEWSQVLGMQIAVAQKTGDPDRGDTYYRHWCAALEQLIEAKRLSSNDELKRYQHAWNHAAERTPHGSAIELKSEDFDR